METLVTVLAIAAPLLFAMLAALTTEYAGVLAVFVEGAITLSGFLFVASTLWCNNIICGFFLGLIGIVFFIFLTAVFTQVTGANPFLTGLSINLFAQGIVAWAVSRYFNNMQVILLPKTIFEISAQSSAIFFTVCALIGSVGLFVFVRYTQAGLNLMYTGSAEQMLRARGVNITKIKISSWVAAAVFSYFAGITLVARLGAFTGNLSAGRGWIAVAAIFLSGKHPLACIPIAFILAFAEYAAFSLQSNSVISQTAVLSLPYIIALLIIVITPVIRQGSKMR